MSPLPWTEALRLGWPEIDHAPPQFAALRSVGFEAATGQVHLPAEGPAPARHSAR